MMAKDSVDIATTTTTYSTPLVDQEEDMHKTLKFNRSIIITSISGHNKHKREKVFILQGKKDT
jgi:hypothetical protein